MDDILLPDSQEDQTADTVSQTNGNDYSWTSSAIEKENDKIFYSSFSNFVDGIELLSVSINDYVHVHSCIAKVTALWESDSLKKATILLLFRPRQTKQQEKPYHGKAELIPSNLILDVPLHDITGICTVETLNEFRSRSTFPDYVFYTSECEFCSIEPGNTLTLDDIKKATFESNELVNVSIRKSSPTKAIIPNTIPKKDYKRRKTIEKTTKQSNHKDYEDFPLPEILDDNDDLMEDIIEDKTIVKDKTKYSTQGQAENPIDLDIDSMIEKYHEELERMSKSKLQVLCKDMKLSDKGKKLDLISRVLANYKSDIVIPKSDSVSSPKNYTRYPSAHFGPREEVKLKNNSITPRKRTRYDRVKVDEALRENISSDFSELTAIERLELGIHQSGFKGKDIKLSSDIKIKPEIPSDNYNTIYKDVQSRLSPKKSSNSSTKSPISKPIKLESQLVSPKKKETKFNNVIDLATVQQRDRRTSSSANLDEEIALSSDDDDECIRSILESTESKPRTKLKRLTKKTSDFPKLKDFDSSSEEESVSENSKLGKDSLNDFIVEDDDEIIEQPIKKRKIDTSEEEIIYPNENPHIQQHLSLKHAFTVYIQYITSSFLDDQFLSQLEKDDDSMSYFEPARRKVEHSLVDRKDLIIRSSVWGEEFCQDLDGFPGFSSNHCLVSIDCEACRRSNHASTFTVKLSGKPYDSHCLWNERETKIKLTGKYSTQEYHLGSHCHARTYLYHRLHHYKARLISLIKKKVQPLLDKETVSEVNIVTIIIDDKRFITDLYNELTSLLQEADEFGKLPNKNQE